MSKIPTVAACAVLLAAGVAVAPAAGATQRSGAPTAAKAPAAACTYVDGLAYDGIRLRGVPPRWKYGNSPYGGARFDRCGDVVRFYYGGYGGTKKLDYYELRYGISPNQILRTYRDYTQGSNRIATVTARHNEGYYTSYTLQVRACNLPAACTRWSPLVYLSYYP